MFDGMFDGAFDGAVDGAVDGMLDGAFNGTFDWMSSLARQNHGVPVVHRGATLCHAATLWRSTLAAPDLWSPDTSPITARGGDLAAFAAPVSAIRIATGGGAGGGTAVGSADPKASWLPAADPKAPVADPKAPVAVGSVGAADASAWRQSARLAKPRPWQMRGATGRVLCVRKKNCSGGQRACIWACA